MAAEVFLGLASVVFGIMVECAGNIWGNGTLASLLIRSADYFFLFTSRSLISCIVLDAHSSFTECFVFLRSDLLPDILMSDHGVWKLSVCGTF